MKKRKKLIMIILLPVIITGCGRNTLSLQDDISDEKTCTLKEAWEIALSDAQEWSDDAAATLITSADNHDTENPENGIDGKRRCWTFIFHSEAKDKQYSVHVVEGKPVQGQEGSSPHFDTFTMDDIPLDSDDLYLSAGEQLKGGVGWAWGYHYLLQYRYMDEAEEKPRLTFSVRGLNNENQERYMIYDPYSGTLLAILDKTGYDSNGRSIWEIVENHMEEQSPQPEESESPYNNMSREELEEHRKQIEQEFCIYESCVKYRFDPEEFYNAVIDGLTGSRFSPFSNCRSYEEEEWRERMKAYYGEDWEETAK